MRYATGRRRRLTTGVLADDGVVVGVAPPADAPPADAPPVDGVVEFVVCAFKSTTTVPETYSLNFNGNFVTKYFFPIFILSKKAFVRSYLILTIPNYVI